MALKIYSNADPDEAFSIDGEHTNSMRHSFDGRIGGVIERRYYLRNDDAAYTYTDITLTPVDAGGRIIVDGTDGYSFKMKVGDTQPLDEEWEIIDPATVITFADISDTTTYLPFWLRIEVPRGAAVESFSDVSLQIDATQNVV